MPDKLRPVLVRMLEGRVGSTLMMQLLGSSPEVAMDRVYPYQNSYLTYFVMVSERFAKPVPMPHGVVDYLYEEGSALRGLPFDPLIVGSRELGRACLAATWHAFGLEVMATQDKRTRLYAEKYWGSVQPLVDAGIEPVLIDLVRDPRDIMASARAFNERRDGALFGRPAAPDEWSHFRRMVLTMALRFEELDQPVAAPRLIMRYEDLVGDLAASAARVGAVAGVTLDPEAAVADQAVALTHMTSSSPSASVGRWRQDLSDREAEFVSSRLGAHMERFGYL